MQYVVIFVAEQQIVSCLPFQQVIIFATEQQVITRTAGNSIVAGIAIQQESTLGSRGGDCVVS